MAIDINLYRTFLPFLSLSLPSLNWLPVYLFSMPTVYACIPVDVPSVRQRSQLAFAKWWAQWLSAPWRAAVSWLRAHLCGMWSEGDVGQTQCNKCTFLWVWEKSRATSGASVTMCCVLAFLASAIKWFLVATECEIELQSFLVVLMGIWRANIQAYKNIF